MANWVSYENGNYTVKFNLDDGTKIRENDLDNLTPAFAENCDVCLTKRCSQQCKFCYEGCTPDGEHSDIMNQKWIHTLHPYTELAINGNDLDHPQLVEFLRHLKKSKVIANITVNQAQFMEHQDKINSWYREGLINGLGVSLINPTDSFITEITKYPNAVIHTINGILNPEHISKLKDNNLKLLVLGYKDLKRGHDYLNSEHSTELMENMDWLKKNIKFLPRYFDVISFDNLAIKQLDVKDWLGKDKWEEFYMGDDGTSTFYIDAVSEKFAMNSVAPEDKRFDLLDSVDEMFEVIRNVKSK